jgi:hypothetical protein
MASIVTRWAAPIGMMTLKILTGVIAATVACPKLVDPLANPGAGLITATPGFIDS